MAAMAKCPDCGKKMSNGRCACGYSEKPMAKGKGAGAGVKTTKKPKKKKALPRGGDHDYED